MMTNTVVKVGGKKTRKMKLQAYEPGDYNSFDEYRLDVEFKIIPKQQWKEMVDDKMDIDESLAIGMVSFNSIKDMKGMPHPREEEIKEDLTEEPWVVAALAEGQQAIQGGMTQKRLHGIAKQKN